MAEKEVRHTDCPMDGPMDGVIMTTDCIRTDFLENPAEEEAVFQQREKTEAHISASMEIGVFSIRDMESGIMLTVSLYDAMEAMAEAVEAGKKHGSYREAETKEE